MEKFAQKKLRGQVYNLSHLNDVTLTTDHGAEKFRVLVVFSCHCFTEEINGHSPDYRYTHEGEERAFCIERYQASLDLPRFVREAMGKIVYHSRQQTYFFVRTNDGAYTVYFNVIASKTKAYDVIMNIQSAYIKDRLADTAAPVAFGNLIAATAQGRVPPLGKPTKITRS